MGKGKIVLMVVGVLLLFALIWGGVMGWRYYTASIVGKTGAQEEVQSADFRIYSYNHFYDSCAEIQKAEAAYDAQYDLLQSMEPGTDQYERQQRVVAVQKQWIEQLKHQYNADAEKEGTMGQFRANDLPSYINTEQHEYGRRTKCVYQD